MAQGTYLEAIRQGVWRAAAFVFLLSAALTLHAQKIAEVDLTRQIRANTQLVLPPGCEGTEAILSHGDGNILPNGERRKLELQIISLSSLNPVLYSEVEAEIALKNAGNVPVEIPWETDPKTAERPADAKRYEYESGWFWFRIKDATGSEKFVKLLSNPLYSSAGRPQSTLTLLAGQWVTVHLKFRVELDEKISTDKLKPGPAELMIEWRQGSYSWERKGCDVKTGYSSYDSFYE